MAKRFTDTNKYKKPFIRGLQGAYKLLWDYLYHDCDHAGIWIVDFEVAQIYIGSDMPVNKKTALELFNKDEQRIIELDNHSKWFIPSFIFFQYGILSENNRAHNSVITILKKYNLYTNKLLTSPLKGGMDKDKEKVMDKDKEKEMDKEMIYPFENENFIKVWNIWKEYKKKEHGFKYKSEISEQTALQQLDNLSNHNEINAIEILKQSIANGYKGFFELKKSNKVSSTEMQDYKQQILNEINEAC